MNLPKHISIICDGNRRWAKKKGLPEFSGHRHAVNTAIKNLVDHAIKLNIPYLTFWVLSTENWRRGKTWMTQYLKLLHSFMKKDADQYIKKGVKLNLIGDLSKLPPNIQKSLQDWLNKSKNNKKLTLTIAINYGGRDEIIRTINKLPKNKKITEKIFSQHLDTKSIPDPDIIIRTGKRNTRLSGYMLWQIAYSELYFTNTLFPNLTPKELDKAIAWYKDQKRNFGK